MVILTRLVLQGCFEPAQADYEPHRAGVVAERRSDDERYVRLRQACCAITHPCVPLLVVLAKDFKLTAGRVEVTVPSVESSDDYELVCECPTPLPLSLREQTY